jgi:hypothetical protein
MTSSSRGVHGVCTGSVHSFSGSGDLCTGGVHSPKEKEPVHTLNTGSLNCWGYAQGVHGSPRSGIVRGRFLTGGPARPTRLRAATIGEQE